LAANDTDCLEHGLSWISSEDRGMINPFQTGF
jgi:hypothetical protein